MPSDHVWDNSHGKWQDVYTSPWNKRTVSPQFPSRLNRNDTGNPFPRINVRQPRENDSRKSCLFYRFSVRHNQNCVYVYLVIAMLRHDRKHVIYAN